MKLFPLIVLYIFSTLGVHQNKLWGFKMQMLRLYPRLDELGNLEVGNRDV